MPEQRRPATDWLPHVVFLALMFFGGLMVFLVPPIQAPDEDSHFIRTIMLSEGQVFPVREGDRWGQMVPATLLDYVIRHHDAISAREESRYDYRRWTLDTHVASSKEPRVFWSYSGQSISPAMYVPQLAGVLVGKVAYRLTPFAFNWPAALYSARFGNLLAFAILAAFAIRTLPRFRSITTGLILLPMSVHLASSCSYDVTPMLACLWLLTIVTAVCVRGEAPKRHEIIILLATAFLLGHAKLVYAPLLLVVLAMKRSMSRSRLMLLCAGLLGLAAAGAVSGTVLLGLPVNPALDEAASAQASHLLANLQLLPDIVFGSLSTHAGFYFISFMGNLGWLDTNFPVPLLVLIWGLLLLALLRDALQGPSPLGWLGSAAAIAGALASVGAIMLAMYLFATPPGGPIVEGVQGRYFLPVALLAAAAFAGSPGGLSRMLQPLRLPMIEFQIVCQTAILGITIFAIVARYWMPGG